MSMPNRNLSPVQFYHGTNHALSGTVDPSQPHDKNFRVSDSSAMYMTQHADEARWHAGMVTEKHGGEAHTYEVHPTGQVTPDLQQRQPGSFKTKAPVTVVNEV